MNINKAQARRQTVQEMSIKYNMPVSLCSTLHIEENTFSRVGNLEKGPYLESIWWGKKSVIPITMTWAVLHAILWLFYVDLYCIAKTDAAIATPHIIKLLVFAIQRKQHRTTTELHAIEPNSLYTKWCKYWSFSPQIKIVLVLMGVLWPWKRLKVSHFHKLHV